MKGKTQDTRLAKDQDEEDDYRVSKSPSNSPPRQAPAPRQRTLSDTHGRAQLIAALQQQSQEDDGLQASRLSPPAGMKLPQKRPSPSSPSQTSGSNKMAKNEFFSPEDFSNSVKKRLMSSSRTGQACDRCKVRKIRCDGLRGGCSPCSQNNTPCRTTDRITGRATSRGYVEDLEDRNRELEERVKELEARLAAYTGGNPGSRDGLKSNRHSMNGTEGGSDILASDAHLANGQEPYQPAPYTYPDPTTSSGISYPAQNIPFTDAAYSNSISNGSSSSSSQAPSAAFIFPTLQQPPSWIGGSQPWRSASGSMAGNLEPQDAYSANALMQLGGRELNSAEQQTQGQTSAAGDLVHGNSISNVDPVGTPSQNWPLGAMFDDMPPTGGATS
ncbi:MAG: hypothetical protein M1829_003424 [Trizodia sp. TS-e1964]|nr:MAG: hypothetical protein M1829_003424 [Trizodia sp. TS-e1964]